MRIDMPPSITTVSHRSSGDDRYFHDCHSCHIAVPSCLSVCWKANGEESGAGILETGIASCSGFAYEIH
jgi:hypothetical protein